MKVSSARNPRPRLFCCSGEAGERLVRSLLGAAGLAILFSLLLSVIGPTPARSAEGATPALPAAVELRSSAPALRPVVQVPSDVVTIGDFFENAGSLAERPLFRAPDLGTSGPVSARRVVDMARAAGLAGAETGGLVEVTVSRLSRPVESAEISRLLAEEAMRRPGRPEDVMLEDLDVTFDGPVEPRHADVRAHVPARVVSFTMAPQTGRFDALVQIDQGEKSDRVRLRGTVVETAAVTVLTRALARGDVVAPEDLRAERLPRNRLGTRAQTVDAADIVGHQARRALRIGQPVAAGDFARPQVIARGETVTVVYRTRALTVTTRGQALQAGAVGDLVGVLNPQSKRTLQATIAGPGLVEIAAPRTDVAALSAPAKAEQ